MYLSIGHPNRENRADVCTAQAIEKRQKEELVVVAVHLTQGGCLGSSPTKLWKALSQHLLFYFETF